MERFFGSSCEFSFYFTGKFSQEKKKGALPSKTPFSSGVNFRTARIWPNTNFPFPNDRNSIRISFNALSVAKHSRRIFSVMAIGFSLIHHPKLAMTIDGAKLSLSGVRPLATGTSALTTRAKWPARFHSEGLIRF
jgi:hypothetical protein